jgi:serine-type D-Ala-D-Ala carboxypeptidase/endopeptidase
MFTKKFLHSALLSTLLLTLTQTAPLAFGQTPAKPTAKATTATTAKSSAQVSAQPPAQSPTSPPQNLAQALNNVVRQRLSNDLSGACVAVVAVPGKGIKAETAYFCANAADTKRKVDATTVFEIGSISKALMGTLLADLELRGKVNANDPIKKYLANGLKIPDFKGREITLLDLATHTSGLPSLPSRYKPTNTANFYAELDANTVTESLADVMLTYEPGSKYAYSNFGGLLLSRILSLQSQRDFNDAMIERIATPLKMTDTTSLTTKTRLATPHSASGKVVSQWDFYADLAGMGGIKSTLPDMQKFLEANLEIYNNPEGVLAKSAIGMALKKAHSKQRAAQGPMDIAYGWHRLTRNGSTIVFHNGQTAGFHAFMGFDPTTGRGAVVLADSAIAIDDLGFNLTSKEFPLGKPRLTASLDSAAIDGVVGEYELPNVVLKFAREGTGSESRLFVYTPGRGRTELFVDSNGLYYPKEFDALARFEKNKEGIVEAVLWMQGGGAERGKKRVANNFKLEAKVFAEYIGEYVFNPSFAIRVFERDARYFAQASGQSEFEIIADEKDRFSVKVITAKLNFTRSSTGAVESMTLIQNGNEIVGKRSSNSSKPSVAPSEAIAPTLVK